MRDIVYRKVGQTPADPPISPQITPVATAAVRTPSFVESLTERLNYFGGLIRKYLSDYQPRVVTPPRFDMPPAPSAHKMKAVRKEKRHRMMERAKEKGRRTKQALKTPVGKVALVHSLAFLALLGYVVATRHPQNSTAQTSVADSTTSASVRQYLPVGHTSSTPQPFKESEATVPQPSTTLNAWLTPWNIADLSTQSSAYASVSAFWLTLSENGSDIVPKADWAAWNTFRQNNHTDNQKMYLSITGDPDAVYKALSDSSVQQQQISHLLQTVKDHGFDGIDIDYEGLGSDNRDLFTAFIRNLSAAFHAEKKSVAVTLEARIANQVPMDWRNLGLIADQLRLMVYDYHSRETNFPGPVAPLSWVKEVTEYAVNTIEPSKVVIGLGNYGYDWQQDDTNPNLWHGTGLSFDQAVSLAKTKNTPVIQASGIDDRGYDIGLVPTFTYQDDQGKQHSVWFEDKDSLQSKVNLVSQYPVSGVIFWSVGLGDKTFWTNSNN